MATFEARVTRLESLIGRQIKPNERDPELVEFIRHCWGSDVPLENIPCGISAQRVIDRILADAQGTYLPIVP